MFFFFFFFFGGGGGVVTLRPSQKLWPWRTVSSPNQTFCLGKLEQALKSDSL